MGLARTLSVALVGLQGHLVEVEADVAGGLPGFVLVGLPDASLAEARDRVRAASANSGWALPQRRLTVNLSPASLPKMGSSFDVAVAVAMLAASQVLPVSAVADVVHLGELGLDGRLRPVRGVLPAVLAAVRCGVRRVVVPVANALEARLVPQAQVVGLDRLSDVVAWHRGQLDPHLAGAGTARAAHPDTQPAVPAPDREPPRAPDLAEVIGQQQGRLAVEVAAAGGHHLLLVGPPGAGKTMLAARLPGLLPPLEEAQALEVTAVHSVSGTLDPGAGLLRRPPYEDPHHTASAASVIGGGSGVPRPGAASRAHRGVLFLDEAPEFHIRVLEALRQPLEQGELVIHRSRGSARFPARFQLVLAANPCPCGRSGRTGAGCGCTSLSRRRYLSRLSGPLLDRVDLQVGVHPVSRAEMAYDQQREGSAAVARRVAAARGAQRERLAGAGVLTNSEVTGTELRGPLRLPGDVTADLDRALERATLTVRGYDRVLRVAWTLADLAGRTVPSRDDVGLALWLRQGTAGAA